MTDPTPNRPLWRVMDDSYGTHLTNRESYAAMLRAIAEWIKQREQRSSVVAEVIDVSRWLHEEADRAEAEAGE